MWSSTKGAQDPASNTGLMAQPIEKNTYYVGGHEPSSPPPNDGNYVAPQPRPESSRRWFQAKQTLHRWWALEAFSSFFALAIFACIIGLLALVDDEPYGDATNAQANAKKRPIIFTYLSFLSALMRAAMLLPVATAIGQLKWSWFRSSKQLIDLERFDSAAGSMFGSAKLLFALKFRSVAAIGAALTILALPMDALIQSSVLMPSRLDVNTDTYYSNFTKFPFNVTDTTIMPRTTWYGEWQTMEDKSKPWPATSLINAIQFGQTYVNGLSDVVEAVTKVNCPTGYCNFTESQTLGVGSICVDRTPAMITVPARGNESAYQTLPGTDLQFFYNGSTTNGYYSQIIAAKSYTGWPDQEFNKTVYGGIPGPLIVRTAMMLSTWENYTMGVECALYWQVATELNFVNDVSQFKLDVEHLDVNYTFVPGNNATKRRETLWDIKPDTCIVEGKTIAPSDSDFYKLNCIHSVGRETGRAFQNFLLDDRDGFVGESWLKSVNLTTNETEWTRTNTFITNIYESATDRDPDQFLEMLDSTWGNVAFMTSFTVRRASTTLLDGRSSKALNTTGIIYRPVYFYKIEWPRLIMPAIILLSAAGFVLCTAILTWHEYAWRKSNLPLLFHGLEDREKAAMGDVRDFQSMQLVAENMKVRLTEHVDMQGARFTTQHN